MANRAARRQQAAMQRDANKAAAKAAHPLERAVNELSGQLRFWTTMCSVLISRTDELKVEIPAAEANAIIGMRMSHDFDEKEQVFRLQLLPSRPTG